MDESSSLGQEMSPLGESKRKSKKIVFILIGVFLLFIIYLSVRMYLKADLAAEQERKIEDLLNGHIVKSINQSSFSLTGRYLSANNDLNELKTAHVENKRVLESKTNRLKSEGIYTFYDKVSIVDCGNGFTFDFNEQTRPSNCTNPTFTHQETVKEYSRTETNAIVALISQSTLMGIIDYPLDSLEKMKKEEKQSSLEMIANTLNMLSFISRQGMITADLFRLTNGYDGVNSLNWSVDTSSKIVKLEQVDDSWSIPSAEEINDVQIVDKCKLTFDKIVKKDNSFMFQLFTYKALLLSPSMNSICAALDLDIKESMIKMRERTAIEKNVFISISNKMHLDLFVKCGVEELSLADGEMPCTNRYLNDTRNKIVDHINTSS